MPIKPGSLGATASQLKYEGLPSEERQNLAHVTILHVAAEGDGNQFICLESVIGRGPDLIAEEDLDSTVYFIQALMVYLHSTMVLPGAQTAVPHYESINDMHDLAISMAQCSLLFKAVFALCTGALERDGANGEPMVNFAEERELSMVFSITEQIRKLVEPNRAEYDAFGLRCKFVPSCSMGLAHCHGNCCIEEILLQKQPWHIQQGGRGAMDR